MKINWTAGMALASALALVACDGGSTDSKGNGTAAANAAAPAGTAAAPAGNAGAPTDGASGQTAGARQDFTVVNNTGQTVMTLNVSSSAEEQWGPDILGRDVLANGESAQISFERGESQCQWDLRVTYQDGDTGDWRGINLCETATVTLTAE